MHALLVQGAGCLGGEKALVGWACIWRMASSHELTHPSLHTPLAGQVHPGPQVQRPARHL